jgi:formylmethanofuran dehydrogenase subunit A
MASMRVKGGYVYDPTNGVDGEKMDILIKDGKVVEELKGRAGKAISGCW